MPKVTTDLKCPTCGCYERYIRAGRKWGDCVNCTKQRQRERTLKAQAQNGKKRGWQRDTRPRCACGVLLDNPLVPFIGGDKCAWCEAEARGLNMRRMVMA